MKWVQLYSHRRWYQSQYSALPVRSASMAAAAALSAWTQKYLCQSQIARSGASE